MSYSNLVLSLDEFTWNPSMNLRSTIRFRPDAKGAAQRLQSLAQTDEPQPAAAPSRLFPDNKSDPVVVDAETDTLWGTDQPNLDGPGLGILAHVLEGFLYHTKEAERLLVEKGD